MPKIIVDRTCQYNAMQRGWPALVDDLRNRLLDTSSGLHGCSL